MPPVLRTYPPRFARRVTKYYDRFCAQRVGHCPETDGCELMTAYEVLNVILHEHEDDEWFDAELVPAFFI